MNNYHNMKSLIFPLCLCIALTAFADDAKPSLVQPGKVVAQPDLKQPLGSEWNARHGTWEPKDGELVVAELPENKHAAVLWHQVGMQSAIVECEFQFDGGRTFLIGCDTATKHIGRLVITPKLAKISEDSSEVKGKRPGTTLGEVALDLKPGQWYPVRFEWTGDKMAACVAGKTIQGQHPYLATTKARWWFAVSGAKVRVKNIKVCEGK